MSDGTIHLDFTSDGSFLNAAEIVPAESDGGAPMRMLAGPAVFHDDQGNIWSPERFFHGGRRSFHPDNLPKVANARLFEWERYGALFHYLIPVVAGKELPDCGFIFRRVGLVSAMVVRGAREAAYSMSIATAPRCSRILTSCKAKMAALE